MKNNQGNPEMINYQKRNMFLNFCQIYQIRGEIKHTKNSNVNFSGKDAEMDLSVHTPTNPTNKITGTANQTIPTTQQGEIIAGINHTGANIKNKNFLMWEMTIPLIIVENRIIIYNKIKMKEIIIMIMQPKKIETNRMVQFLMET